LLVAETGLSEESLEGMATYYGVEDIVLPLMEFLRT